MGVQPHSDTDHPCITFARSSLFAVGRRSVSGLTAVAVVSARILCSCTATLTRLVFSHTRVVLFGYVPLWCPRPRLATWEQLKLQHLRVVTTSEPPTMCRYWKALSKKWPRGEDASGLPLVDVLEPNDSLRHIHATLLSPATQHRVSCHTSVLVLPATTSHSSQFVRPITDQRLRLDSLLRSAFVPKTHMLIVECPC